MKEPKQVWKREIDVDKHVQSVELILTGKTSLFKSATRKLAYSTNGCKMKITLEVIK